MPFYMIAFLQNQTGF